MASCSACCWPPAATINSDRRSEDQSGFPFVSKWGADPVWLAAPVE